jgi:hypothetical protein
MGYHPDWKVILEIGELRMRNMPFALVAQFEVILRERAVPRYLFMNF